MVTRNEMEEFREEMKRDAYENAADIATENKLRTDYDAFVDYHQEMFDEALQVLEELRDRHTEYGHEFDVRELI